MSNVAGDDPILEVKNVAVDVPPGNLDFYSDADAGAVDGLAFLPIDIPALTLLPSTGRSKPFIQTLANDGCAIRLPLLGGADLKRGDQLLQFIEQRFEP
jgi:hypothetical protein